MLQHSQLGLRSSTIPKSYSRPAATQGEILDQPSAIAAIDTLSPGAFTGIFAP
jgi:hypothetical protein